MKKNQNKQNIPVGWFVVLPLAGNALNIDLTEYFIREH